jgi:hypothetical protein
MLSQNITVAKETLVNVAVSFVITFQRKSTV